MKLKLVITDEDDEVMFSYASPQANRGAENLMCSEAEKEQVRELLEESIRVLGDE
jgi:hypothetical protein